MWIIRNAQNEIIGRVNLPNLHNFPADAFGNENWTAAWDGEGCQVCGNPAGFVIDGQSFAAMHFHHKLCESHYEPLQELIEVAVKNMGGE